MIDPIYVQIYKTVYTAIKNSQKNKVFLTSTITEEMSVSKEMEEMFNIRCPILDKMMKKDFNEGRHTNKLICFTDDQIKGARKNVKYLI